MTNPFAILLQTGATELWPEESHPWLHLLARFGPYALGAVLAFLVVRALVRQRRYRAVSVLGERDQAAVHAALLDAEKRTVGEIVPVVLERSDDHAGARWACALVTLLVFSFLLEAHLSWMQPHWLLLEQLGFGALGYGLAWLLPDLQRTFVSEGRATEMAEEQALLEFHRLGLHRTEARTGVLLFVSLFERRVIVLGDEGIASKVGQEHWEATREHVLSGIRRGSLAHGLVEGIRTSGQVLAEHHPWTNGDRNELPDRLIVRRR
ncbi:MAG: hypothetical protein IPJ77_10455 [Planctomycetes bacterium]|nr:hypothetical protein [Planctomycetota bacterium]